ncbi:Retinol dehydrogenase 13 [Cercospora beticola]|uniref:Retinol dehydrogenase 13 n=1 Tax=Cercospora beticola TaxID=122368 RepID=A0A2G5I7U2_CERBT|nr:Retinol dehydrogenase 13 [Cercospora beticola]PIB00868.1 Retinol dehydrogenase 13 [Cercospora beticola]WPA95411.1 hypothetical protein RHO25_000010 [Cercospora beticola]
MPVPLPFLGGFLYRQLFITPSLPKARFDGQNIIVTGSNVGLGLEAARHFARLGASRVVLAVRDLAKGEAAKKSIDRDVSPSCVTVMRLDLTSYDSVQEFAARIDEELDRLDVLCANAGIATGTFRIAEQDESTITTNVVSTFLLAFLLLPKLKTTAERYNVLTTLTFTSSEVHEFTDFRAPEEEDILTALSDPVKANMGERYFVSKLLQVFTTREMAARVGDSYPVVINCLNPGFCHSELAREAGWYLYIMAVLLARSTEVGSRTIVAAAAAGPESHGKYMSESMITEPGEMVRSREGTILQRKFWAELCARLESIKPGITAKL